MFAVVFWCDVKPRCTSSLGVTSTDFRVVAVILVTFLKTGLWRKRLKEDYEVSLK